MAVEYPDTPNPKIVGDPAAALGAAPTLDLAGRPYVWHVGTLDADATLSVAGFEAGHRLELHYVQAGGVSLSIDDGSGPVPVSVPGDAGSSIMVIVEWVTDTEARIVVPGSLFHGVDAGVYHGNGEIITNTAGGKTYFDGFDAGWRNGAGTDLFVPRQTGLEIVEPGLYMVTANFFGFNGASALPISWGVDVDRGAGGGDVLKGQEVCNASGTTFRNVGTYKWFYEGGKLTMWTTHADASMEFYCSMGALLLRRDIAPGADLSSLPV